MTSKKKVNSTNEETRAALVPKLRFPAFREAEGWVSGKVDDLVDTITPPKKLPTASYAPSGAFPIIDQSQPDISGWTDDNEALIREGLPLIVFGDHTCILKLISRPFVQGADGIKILKSRSQIGAPFLFHSLSHQPIATEEYKRHYSILKEKIVFYPNFKSGEQQKISECMSSADELIATQTGKIDALKTYKTRLMQKLFPHGGETQPGLRFPEFKNTAEWGSKPLGELGKIITGKTPNTKEPEHWGGNILFITPTDISEEDKYQNSSARTVVETKSTEVLPEGSIVYTCIASIGKMALTVHPSITNQQINSVIPNESILGEFLYYALANLTPWIKTIPATNTLPIINKTDFSKIAILHPIDKDEQQRIASCLSSLDVLISAETQKLQALKTHKKGLMQQLFLSPEGRK